LRGIAPSVAFLIVLLGPPPLGELSHSGKPGSFRIHAAPSSAARAIVPLAFVPNAGQFDPGILYAARGAGYAVRLTRDAVIVSSTAPGSSSTIRFLGANPEVRPRGRTPAPGRVNYFLGSDPARWRAGLVAYREVVYHDLWPGIDLVLRGGAGELEGEFVLAPGAKPENIRLASEETDGAGRVAPAASGLALAPDSRLEWSTFLGGADGDVLVDVVVDREGNAYVAGETFAGDYPTTPGAYDPSYNGGFSDAVVTKIAAGGSSLVYSTFLGGSGHDVATGIALDSEGNAVLTGMTQSADFPATPGSYDVTFNGNFDVFIAKLGPDGSRLIYSTFLGGRGEDTRLGGGIAVDSEGNAYIAEATASADFPTTPGAFDRTFNGGFFDGFVAKLDATGSRLVYSTFLGGAQLDEALRLAVDATGAVYTTGYTNSLDFPTTPAAFDRSQNGFVDAFVTKLDPTGSALVYSTYLGGSDYESGGGLVVDDQGHAYVGGSTGSLDFPATKRAFDRTFNGGDLDAYVAKLDPSGSALVYATYLGGFDDDGGGRLAVDDHGLVLLPGITSSPNFPTTPDALDTSHNGVGDAFVTQLNAAGSGLVWSTFLGGARNDGGLTVALAGEGSFLLTGITDSSEFPTTAGAYDRTFNGGVADGYVARITLSPAPCGGRVITIPGTAGDDVLVGTPGPDVIAGFEGDDRIQGGEGDDVLCGGGGDDLLLGGPGRDQLLGETGGDRLRGGADGDLLAGGVGNDQLFGETGSDALLGGAGSDAMDGGSDPGEGSSLSSFDTCDGGPGGDTAANCEEVENVP
jgi:hypothetical protein